MKNVTLFFMAMTCVTANAQYNQTRSGSSPLLSPVVLKPTIKSSYDSPNLSIPYHLLVAKGNNTPQIALTNYNAPGVNSGFANQSFWSGSTMTQRSKTGMFESTQYFDQMGNLTNTKSTINFKSKRKK